MDDLINRQFAIDNMARVIWGYPNEIYPQLNDFSMALELAKDGLMGVPSAQKKGHWVDGKRMKMDGTYYWFRQCSVCDYERNDDDSDKDTNFCPNCGADMRGDDDG